VKVYQNIFTLATDSDTTTISGVGKFNPTKRCLFLACSIRVSTQIAGLGAAESHWIVLRNMDSGQYLSGYAA